MIIKCLEDLKINYRTTVNGSNRLVIRFTKNNIVSISYPKNSNKQQVENFVNQNIDKILEKYNGSIEKRKIKDLDPIYIYGKKYLLRLIKNPHCDVIKNDDMMVLFVYYKEIDKISSLINGFLLNLAKELFPELLYKSFLKFGDKLKKFPILEIKRYRSRFGTCYFLRNLIILNLSLVHYDVSLIEFVICHELTHLLFPNHSKEFHQQLTLIVGNEKPYKEKLKQNVVYEPLL